MDLADYYKEVTKTAGLTTEVEFEDEKVAAVVAVTEQFDIDRIEFENEDEKIAAAIAIVDGFEAVMEKEAGVKDIAAKVMAKMKAGAGKAKEHTYNAASKVKEHLKAHKAKYLTGGAAAAAAGAGFAAGRASK
jgi:hypothetical protein